MLDALVVQDEPCHQAQASGCSLGKRQSRESSVTPGPSPTISSLHSVSRQEGALSVFCRVQRRAFLVDSGADVSVYPATPAQMKCCFSAALKAANGTSIRTFGKKTIKLSFAGLKVVHTFLLADVKKPILGTDFFRDNDLIIDLSLIHI